jgi:hypothetical protein
MVALVVSEAWSAIQVSVLLARLVFVFLQKSI